MLRLVVLGSALAFASPWLAVPAAESVVHALDCPADTEPATSDWPGGERVLSCRRCPESGPCVPHGPGEQWWLQGPEPVRLWHGHWDEGRKQGEWVFSTYAGEEFLRVEFERGVPVGAPAPDCPPGRAPASEHVWPGGPWPPPPERVEIWVYCRDLAREHTAFRRFWDPPREPRFEGPVLQWSPHGRIVVAERRYVEGRDSPGTGVVETLHPNGRVESRTRYVDGQEHGRSELFYPSGALRRTLELERGRHHGELRVYDEHGTLVTLSHYREGHRHGPQQTFYPDGAPKTLETWVDSTQQGLQLHWHEDGTLAARHVARDGHWEGVGVTYHATGAIETLAVYAAGRRDLELRGLPDGRWMPDTKALCQGQGGRWLVFVDHSTTTRCDLPDAQTHARCAADGRCAPACRIDERATRAVCPAAAALSP